jgi:murein DD-endopeptidase MepM/ murein hydrolase activator NlpD
VLAPAFQMKVVLPARPRCGDRRRPSGLLADEKSAARLFALAARYPYRRRNGRATAAMRLAPARVCLAVPLLVAYGGSRAQRSVEEWRERLLATSLTALMSFGVMLGTSLPSAAVEGFAKQPAGLLNIASEPDSARPDDEAGGQPGGSSWSLTRNEPRLGEVSAGAGTEVEAANAPSPGEPVAAPVSGRVVFAAPFRSYGPLLIIAHDGYYTVLWGFAKLEVMVNDLLAEGQTVGFIGGEGETPSMLHVESRRNGPPRRGRGEQARAGG